MFTLVIHIQYSYSYFIYIILIDYIHIHKPYSLIHYIFIFVTNCSFVLLFIELTFDIS